MSASKPTKSKFDQHSYAKGVLEFYGASRKTSDDELEKYCHITGWQAPSTVECAHIVPKYLESEELSYLYGVRETMLSEPRNDGLDKGWIVIVPDKSLEGEEITWRCILVEQSRGSSIICPGRKWRCERTSMGYHRTVPQEIHVTGISKSHIRWI
ncbi:hypothetical protein M7I_4378 [Glarea lozoyensis 74030]|uniref:HNH nuclease domain-containing protein n=1 Tax=Glarea lozoyensis (strain ATCC 74030 / MF5533) TaxID=1104152 RepID=H0EP12_GLAL7|nr:hypothetical protein M7I_4378 [Glarea lozoyensis 74030]